MDDRGEMTVASKIRKGAEVSCLLFINQRRWRLPVGGAEAEMSRVMGIGP